MKGKGGVTIAVSLACVLFVNVKYLLHGCTTEMKYHTYPPAASQLVQLKCSCNNSIVPNVETIQLTAISVVDIYR